MVSKVGVLVEWMVYLEVHKLGFISHLFTEKTSTSLECHNRRGVIAFGLYLHEANEKGQNGCLIFVGQFTRCKTHAVVS